MTAISSLPLFPLHTVLFPSQLLPLHIFEPRYRLMISECLAGRSTFGVVLIRDGAEVGERAVPFEVGTTARIDQVNRLSDGRMNLLCVGQSRFRITGLRRDLPYLNGEVELWPWAPLDQGEIDARPAALEKMLSVYIRRLASATGNAVQLDDMPSEPEPLANLAAIMLQIPNHEKQALLAAPALDDLIDGCLSLLRRENRALKIAAALPMAGQDGGLPFSQN